MAIKNIDIYNVLVFQRQLRINNNQPNKAQLNDGDTLRQGFHLDFLDGINVLIGENGVGKTSILKMLYAATMWSNEKVNANKTKYFAQYFSNTAKDNSSLKNAEFNNENSYFTVSDGVHEFRDELMLDRLSGEGWLGLNLQSVFIPTTEMLSHSKGFLAMNEKYSMPFDGTQVDIIVNASLPETRVVPKSMDGILKKISKVIDGEVVQEDDVFYIIKKDGCKIDFSLEAEGLRKLGLLWKLIRNGLLEENSILFWDEPEANLNPELYPLVADILLELEKNHVQIFIATHSYNFAKYLEIKRDNEAQVMFINIYKASSEMSDKVKKLELHDEPIGNQTEIYSSTAYRLEDLENNAIINADLKLLDEVYEG